MHTPGRDTDIFLPPGDWHFGEGAARMRTVLGTCVSVVFWHPELRIGGMLVRQVQPLRLSRDARERAMPCGA